MNINTSSFSGDIIQTTKNLFPTLTPQHHKGNSGRLMVIGGSFEYTGAPYFAAISALRLGADLVHVFCPKEAGVVIKSYSPELIVHPLLDDESKVAEMVGWLSRMHAVVVGPGLGANEAVLNVVEGLIGEVQKLDLPLIIDADGLRLVNRNTCLITNHQNTIITPNAVEFKRLCTTLGLENEKNTDARILTEELSQRLGNVTVIRKGAHDIISNGINSVTCDHAGSQRRCGGQGDILAGFACTLAYWARLNNNNNNNSNNNNNKKEILSCLQQQLGPAMTAATIACLLTKQVSLHTFKLKGRSMLTSDMIENISDVVKGFE